MGPKVTPEEQNQNIDGLRVPLPADHISWEKEGKSILGQGFPRWGEDPRALFTRRASRRGRSEAKGAEAQVLQ